MVVKMKNVNWKTPQFVKMIEDDTIRFDHPIQREAEQWPHVNESLFIDSIINNYPILPIFFLRIFEEREVNGKTEQIAVREVIDGKQRLTTIYKYLTGKFALTADLPLVELYGETYEIAGKYFEELDEPIKLILTGEGKVLKGNTEDSRTLLTYTIDETDTSDEEIEEIFFRLNSSQPLTIHHKTKAMMGTKFSRLINTAKKHKTITELGNFPPGSMKKDEHQSTLLQVMMILEDYPYKKFSSAEVAKYAKTIKNDYKNKAATLATVEKALDYLSEVFSVKQKFFLKKINFPMTVVTAIHAMEKGIDSGTFSLWTASFEDSMNDEDNIGISTEYVQFTGVGSTDLAKVKGRLTEMRNHFDEYTALLVK